MIFTGTTSVTFRKLKAGEVVALAKKAGLDGIEWGGDIHVPHGNLQTADEVRKMTLDEGLKVSSYGSYYTVGDESPEGVPFEKVLETALRLGAPVIRVWAGNRGSAEADDAWWDRVVGESRRIAELSVKCGVAVAFEFHNQTLTDTALSTVKLMKAIRHEGISTYWQPQIGLGRAERLEGLGLVGPWLSNLHAFWWYRKEEGVYDRRPLSEGREDWLCYLREAARHGGDRYVLLEFVRDDDPAAFLEDARTLIGLAESVG